MKGGKHVPRNHDMRFFIVDKEEGGEYGDIGMEGLYGELSMFNFDSIDFVEACLLCSINLYHNFSFGLKLYFSL